MKVKDLVKKLKTFNQEAEFLVSCDEEMNTLFEKFEVAHIEENNYKKDVIVIFGLSGSEVEL